MDVQDYVVDTRRSWDQVAAPDYQFNRPLGVLFGSFFRAGFVLDAFEEVVSPPPADPARIRRVFSWARFREIPPFVVGRLRPAELRTPS